MKSLWMLIIIAGIGCNSSKQPDPTPSPTSTPDKPAERSGPIAVLAFTIPNPNQEKQPIHAAAISPDGGTIAISIYTEPIRLWDTATGKELQILKDSKAGPLQFSPDGKILAVASSKGFKNDLVFWDTQKWIPTLCEMNKRTDRLSFSPDGKWLLAVGFDESATVWNLATKSIAKSIDALKGELSAVFSADSKHLYWPKGEIGVWDIAADKELPSLPYKGRVFVSPDGRLILCDRQGVDWKAAKVEWELPLPNQEPSRASFSPNGSVLATSGLSGIVLWNTANGKPLLTLSERMKGSRGFEVEFARSGGYLILQSGDEIRVWKYHGK